MNSLSRSVGAVAQSARGKISMRQDCLGLGIKSVSLYLPFLTGKANFGLQRPLIARRQEIGDCHHGIEFVFQSSECDAYS